VVVGSVVRTVNNCSRVVVVVVVEVVCVVVDVVVVPDVASSS